MSSDPTERWHRAYAEVLWTDSGKMIVRHILATGARANHVFDIGPDKARELTRINGPVSAPGQGDEISDAAELVHLEEFATEHGPALELWDDENSRFRPAKAICLEGYNAESADCERNNDARSNDGALRCPTQKRSRRG